MHMRKSGYLYKGPTAAYTAYTSAVFGYDQVLVESQVTAAFIYEDVEHTSSQQIS